MLKRVGGDDDLIAQMHTWQRSQRFDPRDQAALALAEFMTQHPESEATDELWSALTAHFSDGEIVELVTAIAAFNAFNRIADVLGVEITR